MAEQVTGYTGQTNAQSNVTYQLRVFYNITSRSGNTVTFDMDVHVNYPGSWSSNGCWVNAFGQSRRCNPNVTTGQRNWYASTQSTSRSTGSYWLRNISIGVGATDTWANISIGFSNTAYAAGSFHYQSVAIGFPIGWTGIGTPGTPGRSSDWTENSFTFSWSPASGGTNNPVTSYTCQVQWSGDGSNWSDDFYQNIGQNTSYSGRFTEKDGRGSYRRCRVYASGPYNESAWSGWSSSIRYNYLPNAPTISSPANNASIVPNSSIVFNTATDPGGIVTNDGKVHYRHIIKYGPTFANTSLGTYDATTTKTPSWTSYIGQTVRILGQTGDGWVDSLEGAYRTVKVGTAMTVAAATASTSTLTASTTLTIPAPIVNTNYRIYGVNEYFSLQYSLNNSTWVTLVPSLIRTSSGQITATTTVSNILFRLYQATPNTFLNGTNRTIYFRTTHIAGHLNATSAVRSLTYTAPTISGTITTADGSTTLKFPMNNTIPVTESNFITNTVVSNWTAGNNGTLVIQAKNVTSSTWIEIASRAISANGNANNTFAIANIGIARGQIFELRALLRINLGSSISDFATANINWTNTSIAAADRNKIEYRSLPNVTYVLNSSQRSFLRNGVSTNSVSASYSLKWDINKAYVIDRAYISILDNDVYSIIDDASVPRQLFSTTSSTITFGTSTVVLAARPNSDKTWNVVSGIVTTTSSNVSEAGYVRGNLDNIFISYTFQIREVFRNSPTAAAPSNSLLSENNQFLNFDFSGNTIVSPVFNSGNITFTRVLS